MPNQSSPPPGPRTRPALLWLLLPYVLFLGALPFVNRVTPTVLGLPFLFFWMLLATLLTPAAVWLARRGDLRRGHGRGTGAAGGGPSGGRR
ncbi:DUF3311 domain-containing protein [Streptomyces sp. RS10V-4]|uniref:DUF3311 domain-containing protein n=1 Tax=Streptomyces rhizoryzae TaxID=2932493 RepID=UPI0020039AD8|nr:DUF3311 domain-containing protein [Streptomyces rhizoryzae]MCK7628217.1 DUF3311 domain-containing protein [Streptomyces rhizoryzae]